MKIKMTDLLERVRSEVGAGIKQDLSALVASEVKAAMATVLAELQKKTPGEEIETETGTRMRDLVVDPVDFVRPEYNPKHALARVVRALAIARNDTDRALKLARKFYGDEDLATKGLMRAQPAGRFHSLSKAPQMASDAELGGVFIEPEVLGDWIELLRPTAAVLGLNPVPVDMPTGTITIPRQTGATSAEYVGEASNLPVTSMQFGALNLSAKKLGAIVPVSNDLLRFNSVVNDALVIQDLTTSINLKMDLRAIRGQGTQHSPRGLRYWAPAANIVPSASSDSTPDIAQITTDLEAPRFLLRSGNVNMVRPGWIISPRTERVLRATRAATGSSFLWKDEMDRGMLMGFPFRVSTQIPENLGGSSDETEIYFADFSEVIWGTVGGLLVATSTEASYTDAGVTRSSFQQDCTLVRVMALHDVGVRQEAAIVVITGVKWATAPTA